MQQTGALGSDPEISLAIATERKNGTVADGRDLDGSAAGKCCNEEAALGSDLLALLDALSIPRATVAGYDWGGRAACVVAALHPDRISGFV